MEIKHFKSSYWIKLEGLVIIFLYFIFAKKKHGCINVRAPVLIVKEIKTH